MQGTKVIVLSPYADVPMKSNGISIARADFLPYDPKTNRGFMTPDPDLDESHRLISRVHAIILLKSEGLLVQDCGSDRGTFFYGRRIDITTIAWNRLADATIELGSPCFCVRFLPYKGWVVRRGKKKIPVPFPENHIFKMILGRYKCPIGNWPRPWLEVLLHCENGDPTSSAENLPHAPSAPDDAARERTIMPLPSPE